MTTETLQMPPDFLELSASAKANILKETKERGQGHLRIKVEHDRERTLFEFSWDEPGKFEDFLLHYDEFDIIMDALSIAYILDDYLLDWNGTIYTLSRKE